MSNNNKQPKLDGSIRSALSRLTANDTKNQWELLFQNLSNEKKLDIFVKNFFEELSKKPEQKDEVIKKYLEGYKDKLKEFETLTTNKENLEKKIKELTDENNAKTEEKQKLDNAEAESKKIIEKAKATAENETRQIKEQAQNQAREEAQKEKAAEIQRINELKEKTITLQQEWNKKKAQLNAQEADLGTKQVNFDNEKNQFNIEKATHNLEVTNARNAQEQYERARQSLQERRQEYTSNTNEIEQLKHDVEQKEAIIRSLEKIKQDLLSKQTKFNELEREVIVKINDNNLTADNLISYIQQIEEEKNNNEAKIQEIEKDNQQIKDNLKKANEEKNSWQNQALSIALTQQEVEASRNLVKVSKAICDNLIKEMEHIKTSLDKYMGDPCKELSELDNIEENHKTRGREIDSLENLVKYVRRYAAVEKIYYTEDDIRAFVAGLATATSKLIILQGMSGTGKTSLPRIFAKALNFPNKVIPVESSWRDRNDLLGYYNDFSRQFNAKPFTKELYLAAKQENENKNKNEKTAYPRFITLDEMNLARIEYYFSDFLSVLENPDKEKWEIELSPKSVRVLPPFSSKTYFDFKGNSEVETIWNTYCAQNGDISGESNRKLFNALDEYGYNIGPKYLIDGKKIHIPDDLWFIGTANKDESTFAITDKVYDRAQVISLDERGKRDPNLTHLGPNDYRFITSKTLSDLFYEALNPQNQETQPVEERVKEKLQEIDNILRDRFHLSYGNRIETQAIDYVKIFKAAGGNEDIGLDYQISTKILRKVEYSDNIQGLEELQSVLHNWGDNYSKSTKSIDRIIEKEQR